MFCVALAAIAAAATGPARAQSNNTVTWDNTNVFVAANQDATVSQWDNASFTYGGVTIALSATEPTQFHPYDLDPMKGYIARLLVYGDDGDSFIFTAPEGKEFSRIEITNADQDYTFTAYGDWTKDEDNNKAVWSGTPSSTVTLGGSNLTVFDNLQSIVFTFATPKYTVTMAPGTEDSTSWTIAPAEAPTTGVAEGTTVTVNYGGARKVKDVVATVVPNAPTAVTNALGWDGDLAKVTAESTVEFATAIDGMTITGTLGVDKKVSIADGATVTLDGVAPSTACAATHGQASTVWATPPSRSRARTPCI